MLKRIQNQNVSRVISISESSVNSDMAIDDDNLKIEGYNIVRSDRPSNSIRGDVCIYYKVISLENIRY